MTWQWLLACGHEDILALIPSTEGVKNISTIKCCKKVFVSGAKISENNLKEKVTCAFNQRTLQWCNWCVSIKLSQISLSWSHIFILVQLWNTIFGTTCCLSLQLWYWCCIRLSAFPQLVNSESNFCFLVRRCTAVKAQLEYRETEN